MQLSIVPRFFAGALDMAHPTAESSAIVGERKSLAPDDRVSIVIFVGYVLSLGVRGIQCDLSGQP